jgi:hypothetical protein
MLFTISSLCSWLAIVLTVGGQGGPKFRLSEVISPWPPMMRMREMVGCVQT